MNRHTFLQMPHETDFKLYSSYIETRNMVSSNPNVFSNLKPIHKKLFYFNFLVNSTQTNLEESNYLQEITVDLITCMDLFSLNFIKPARMSLRAAIESFIRLLLKKSREEVGNLGVGLLIEKLKKVYKNKNYLSDNLNQLLSDYGQLCGFVHTSKKQNFTQKTVLQDFSIVNSSELSGVSKQLQRVIENMLFIVICEYPDCFLLLNKFEQYWIKSELNKTNDQKIEAFLLSMEQ